MPRSRVRAARRSLLAFLAAFVLADAHAACPCGTTVIDPTRDYHTYSNTDAFRVEHADLVLDVDFGERRLAGHVDLRLARVAPDADRIVLDTNRLEIAGAWLHDGESLVPLRHELGPRDAVLGAPLTLVLPAAANRRSPLRVRVSYRTDPAAQGLQWLAPAQTSGRKHPFLYSQSQAIYARTWIPLQDTPQVRFTFGARVRTPPALRAVMGASNDAAAPLDGEHTFEMPQPIPSYLMAIAVGDLAFRPTGPRTGVYAEPQIVERAAREFEDTEQMLQAGERLFGPYRWGRYDLLILPPSFPYGGMENPRLTFASPTVIAGDRSLVSLVAHELAHSWSGNLVTNASWRDFWLNEGFTVFLESKIQGALYGADRRAQEDSLGTQLLRRAIDELDARDEILAVDLRDRDPEEGTTDVPYEKGRWFLTWLESRYGEREFAAWVRGYFDHFAFRSINTETFLTYLQTTLVDPNPGVVSMDDVREWVYEPGIPRTAVFGGSDAFARVDAERAKFLAGARAASLATQGWSTQQWQHFLDNLPPKLPAAQLDDLDAAFGFTRSRNAEIEFGWFRNAIRNDWRAAFPRLEEYLVTIGRRKLVRPLYQDLMRNPAHAEFARRVYARARPGYHSITQAAVDEIVTPAAARNVGAP